MAQLAMTRAAMTQPTTKQPAMPQPAVPQPAMPLMTLDRLSVPGRFEPVSLDLHAGELLGLIGPNGAGKSSLLHALAGLLEAGGSLCLLGEDLRAVHPRKRARILALLPQAPQCVWSLTVHDMVSLGRLPWGDTEAHAIGEAMRTMHLEHLAHRLVPGLSFGEQARAAMARVLAGRPRVLLADEPAAALDLFHQHGLLEALREHAVQGNAVVMAMHDLALAARYCHRLLLLDRGRQLALGTVSEVLTEERLTRVYGLDIAVDLRASPPRIEVRRSEVMPRGVAVP